MEWGAEQAMQGGHLFWRRDTDELYAIFDRNKQTKEELMAGNWVLFPQLGSGDNVCTIKKIPPEGTPPMVGGFNWWWCDQGGGPDGILGWPLDKEYGRDNFITQSFDNGLIWKGSDPKVYALLNNGQFFATHP